MRKELTACILLLLTSCSKEEITYSLDKKEVTLIAGEKHQIKILPNDPGSYNYRVETEYYASIEASGLVTGKKVGETSVFIGSRESINGLDLKVTIVPMYNTYIEPLMVWQYTKQDVKAKEKRVLLSETATALVYKSSGLENGLLYTFNSNILSSCVVSISTRYTSDVSEFLLERYYPASLSPIIFTGLYNKTAVGVSLQSSSELWVLYYPFK